MGAKYPEKKRAAIIADALQEFPTGTTLKQTAEKHNIPYITLLTWIGSDDVKFQYQAALHQRAMVLHDTRTELTELLLQDQSDKTSTLNLKKIDLQIKSVSAQLASVAQNNMFSATKKTQDGKHEEDMQEMSDREVQDKFSDLLKNEPALKLILKTVRGDL